MEKDLAKAITLGMAAEASALDVSRGQEVAHEYELRDMHTIVSQG